jgi:hypothetical protein
LKHEGGAVGQSKWIPGRGGIDMETADEDYFCASALLPHVPAVLGRVYHSTPHLPISPSPRTEWLQSLTDGAWGRSSLGQGVPGQATLAALETANGTFYLGK